MGLQACRDWRNYGILFTHWKSEFNLSNVLKKYFFKIQQERNPLLTPPLSQPFSSQGKGSIDKLGSISEHHVESDRRVMNDHVGKKDSLTWAPTHPRI